MHIAFNRNQAFYKLNFKNNIYAQSDFIKNTNIPDETTIIENVADALQENGSNLNKNDVLFSVGRIFEKAGSFDVAKNFYEKLKTSPNLSRKEIDALEFDIRRVREKNATKSKKYWEV